MAEKEDYPVLEEVIAKLDIPRSMVYIECLIMEVNVTRGLDIGTEWRTSQGFSNDEKVGFSGFGATGDSGFGNLGSVAKDGSLPKGFSLGVLGRNITIGGVSFPDIQAIVRAFQSDKDVHILSTPQLLTTENEEAVITVGKNVPFQTRSAAESATEVYSSFEYRDVGITLKITPQISKERLVRLNVFQELTKLDTVNQNNPDRPTTFKRQIETAIIVEDTHSVVIGGLIDESMTRTEYKTPCLGDIPGLGWAFKNLSEGEERTNLYVFLTPRVVKNPLEAAHILKEKKESVTRDFNSGAVPLYKKINEIGKKLSGQPESSESP
jgi:general secretion pathway protein D